MFMQLLKKSLRAKFTLILFIVGVIPLAFASLFFYYTSKEALFNNVFKELKWNVNEIAGVIESHFTETGRELVIASRNTAFTMYFVDHANKGHWVREQQKTLEHLRSIYPDILDEACFIEASGREISRIVFDRLAHEHELSSEEGRSSFFHEAFRMNDGEVFQGRPAISEDTHRWVLPNATPITVKGKKLAILHFEVTLTHFQKLLRRSINPDRGYGFIMNDRGEFMAHTLIDISETEPFPKALSADVDGHLGSIYKKMMEGESGLEQFRQGGKDYYVIFRPINASLAKGRNDNRWSLAYVIPSDRVYVELAILKYNLMAVGAIFLAVLILAYTIGNYFTKPIRDLAEATDKVAGGELPRVEIKREDELGQLSKSFNFMIEAIGKRDEALKALAITDGLTGLYNHRHFKASLDKELKSAQRFSRPLSLIMADADNFKEYNDRLGHTQGDAALKKIAEVIWRNIREVDLAARYGGEEFAVILPETGIEEALRIAERIRKKVVEEVFYNEEQQPGGDVTLSIGVAELSKEMDNLDAFIEAADKNLYRAKEMGRNRVWPGNGEG